MDRIRNEIKCAICHEILESPVILPCNDTICKKHVSNQNKDDFFKCDKCGVEHRIPSNGFQPLPFLEQLIKIGIARLDFGSVHTEAKKSCKSLEEFLKEIEVILKDPFVLTHERISELKNSVQLKGEELKLIIDQEMKKLIDRLDEYERQSKEYLSSNEFKRESEKLEIELKSANSNLDSWLESLKELKFDHKKWENIIEESGKEITNIKNEFDAFTNKLLLNKFDENQWRVNLFKNITIDDQIYNNSILEYVPINRDFLHSSILNNESLIENFEKLLKKKYLNGRKWSLLYQGSRDGFRSFDFHSRCDRKPNTLTIVKSSSGNIFGGYTVVPWKSLNRDGVYEYDRNAFIFSLVNKENRPLIFEQTLESENNENDENDENDEAQGSVWFGLEVGPIFGYGYDLFIKDRSNTNDSHSNLGYTYTHPEFPKKCQRTKTILAGTEKFQVNEIEVFQIQD